jgi:hypothetical protein
MAAFDARACNTHDAVAGIDAQGGAFDPWQLLIKN